MEEMEEKMTQESFEKVMHHITESPHVRIMDVKDLPSDTVMVNFKPHTREYLAKLREFIVDQKYKLPDMPPEVVAQLKPGHNHVSYNKATGKWTVSQ